MDLPISSTGGIEHRMEWLGDRRVDVVAVAIVVAAVEAIVEARGGSTSQFSTAIRERESRKALSSIKLEVGCPTEMNRSVNSRIKN